MDGALPDPPTTDRRARFATAVIEIGGNIIRHAYPPGEAGGLELSLRAWSARLEARYSDRGIPFVPPAPAADLSDDPLLADLPEGGFGLALARAAVDHLDYARTPDGRNDWTLVSHLDG